MNAEYYLGIVIRCKDDGMRRIDLQYFLMLIAIGPLW